MHKLINQSAPGLGRWKQCTECGAAQHTGHWWLAGYKSKTEPPCKVHPWPEIPEILKSWRESAADKGYKVEEVELK